MSLKKNDFSQFLAGSNQPNPTNTLRARISPNQSSRQGLANNYRIELTTTVERFKDLVDTHPKQSQTEHFTIISPKSHPEMP